MSASLARWKQPWAELGLVARMELHADLRKRYSEPHRAYHTLHHISECLELLQQVQGLVESSASIELAIWFHDAIYDPRKSDNELRSAEWAKRELKRAGAPAVLQDRIVSMILVTCHDGDPQSPDEELLSDIDLAILGTGMKRFDDYERQVRQEFQHVPKQQFRAGRRKILAGFLEREQIYFTEWFRTRREAAARANLQRSLTRLAGKFW
jgi:predicted metal-dependent HD superfamily phosphohydrolase